MEQSGLPLTKFIALGLLLLLTAQIYAQTSPIGTSTFIAADSYRARCEKYIDQTVKTKFSAANISTVRFGFIYVAARLLRNQDVDYARQKLDTLVARAALKLESPVSVQYFTLYQLMHTYSLCKNKIPDTLKTDIKNFMQSYDYGFTWGGTLNLTIMPHAAAYIAAQEWPDFVDAGGHSAQDILNSSGKLLSGYMSDFFNEGCYEIDSPIYYTTNIAPTRMLADFVSDQILQRKARSAYHAMLIGMAGAYNKGLYIATPARSKGWDQLGDGLSQPTSLQVINWFFHATSTEKLYYNPGSSNESFNFWLAYPGYTQPLPEMLLVSANRKTPFIRKGYKRKYTYQSENYGLATNDIHTLREDHFRESKGNFLAWQSPDRICHFTIWQENKSASYKVTSPDPNSAGMGENPYSRIRQHQSTAIAVWNVPTTYEYYRIVNLYPKLGIKAIKKNLSNTGWVICHTGTMIFAVFIPNTFTWNENGTKESSTYQGVQRLYERKGYWILETTEITPDIQDPNRNLTNELNTFATLLAAKTNIQTSNYDTDTPSIKYTTLKGDTLELTFHSYDIAYTNQFKVNNQIISNSDKIFEDPYMSLRYESNTTKLTANPLNIFTNGQVARTIYYQQAPTSKIKAQPQPDNSLELYTDTPSSFYYWILPPGANFINNTNAFSARPIIRLGQFSELITKYTIQAFVDDGKIYLPIFSERGNTTKGFIRFNTTQMYFEGFDGSNWNELNPNLPVLNRINAVPIAAYSLRKTISSYTGPCIRVRRSSDQKLQNISFTTSGTLDTIALLNFAAGKSLFITTWYDQTPNARNLIQTNIAKQPRIVSQGVLEKVNGKVAINALGTSTMSPATPPTINYDDCYLSIVKANNTTTNAGGSVFLGTGTGFRFYAETNTKIVWAAGALSPTSYFISIANTIAPNAMAVYSFKNQIFGTNTTLKATVNNVPFATATKPTAGRISDRLVLFSGANADLDDAKTSEFLIFNSALDNIQTKIIEQNQIKYWCQ